MPFPRQGGPPETKFHLGSCLNQRDPELRAVLFELDPTASQAKKSTSGAFVVADGGWLGRSSPKPNHPFPRSRGSKVGFTRHPRFSAGECPGMYRRSRPWHEKSGVVAKTPVDNYARNRAKKKAELMMSPTATSNGAGRAKRGQNPADNFRPPPLFFPLCIPRLGQVREPGTPTRDLQFGSRQGSRFSLYRAFLPRYLGFFSWAGFRGFGRQKNEKKEKGDFV